MNARYVNLALVVAAVLVPAAGVAARGPEGSGLSFLVGSWAGTASGVPGDGVGDTSFVPDLHGQVLVRRSHSEYPAAGGKPPSVHDDLMIIHANSSRAVYFDSEGHLIHYRIATDPRAHSATFLSTDPAPAPLFRLTYRLTSANQLRVTFEISSKHDPAAFEVYVDGNVVRQIPAR